MSISPLAPKQDIELHPVEGVSIATAEAAVKYCNRKDILVCQLDEGTKVAAVFTQSKTSSAAVQRSKQILKACNNEGIRGFIINSGNANAFTGKKGDIANESLAAIASNAIGCEVNQVLTASTGVIGEVLPVGKIEQQLPQLKTQLNDPLSNIDQRYQDAAQAIMTTDTFAKVASVKTKLNDEDIVITGIAKGSGMIAPDMATMLSFIFTDANIESSLLQLILEQVTNQTFNCITVDSDTSTSDSVFLAATAKASSQTASTVEQCHDFIGALSVLMQDLATQIVKDGEGARKFITVNVKGAVTDQSAKVIAMSIANSPLVKTAVAGQDANWGRVIMAIGKAGEPAERDLIKVSMGGVLICADGEAIESYDESLIEAHLQGDDIHIDVDLQMGSGKVTVWTCDLTERYIEINADYRS